MTLLTTSRVRPLLGLNVFVAVCLVAAATVYGYDSGLSKAPWRWR